MTKATEKNLDKILLQIAKQHMRLETLEEQKSDRLDFVEVHVSAIKDALMAAYKAGQSAGK